MSQCMCRRPACLGGSTASVSLPRERARIPGKKEGVCGEVGQPQTFETEHRIRCVVLRGAICSLGSGTSRSNNFSFSLFWFPPLCLCVGERYRSLAYARLRCYVCALDGFALYTSPPAGIQSCSIHAFASPVGCQLAAMQRSQGNGRFFSKAARCRRGCTFFNWWMLASSVMLQPVCKKVLSRKNL